jgi:shikimate kinase
VGKEIAHGLFFAQVKKGIMNIVLIGYRCSGKTRVGRLLAGDLEMAFLDTDSLIEKKTGIPLPAYVSQNGWRDFRRVEREVVEAVALEDNSVIATGGGVVTDPQNVMNLRKNGWLVWLATGTAVIRERMTLAQEQGDLRPPLSGMDPLEEVDSILRERTPAYEQASDCRVWTDGQTPEAIKQAIMKALPYKLRDHTGGIS